MTANKPTAMIELRPTHWAVLTPPVLEVGELLRYPVVEFEPGGPQGHRMEVVDSDWLAPTLIRQRWIEDEERADVREVQMVPQGLVSQVAGVLDKLGYAVEVRDLREDSPRWVRRVDWQMHVPRQHRDAVEAVGRHRALRVTGFDSDRVVGTIAAVARAYPEARIAVAVPTYKMLWSVLRWLRPRLDEPVGLYTAKEKTFGRVSVGLVGQLPRGKGEWDLLALPFAEHTVNDNALRVIMSEQYGRVLSFSRVRETGDDDLDRRVQVIAGHTWPEVKVPVPVTVVVLPTRGTRPEEMNDAFEQKKQFYWNNARRNRRIAAVAKGLVRAKKKSVWAILGDHEQLVEQVTRAAKTGVAILVESLVHARELAVLLPGWAVWSANELEAAKPEPGCGIITTERAAKETVLRAEVLIRATGTRWKLPKIDWPYPEFARSGILIDFADDFHPLAKKNAAARIEGYEKAVMTVHASQEATTNNNGTTGASG